MGELCKSCGEKGLLYNDEQRCEICCYCGAVGEVSLVAGSAAALVDDSRTFCNEDTVTKFRVGKRGVRQGICTSSNSFGTMGRTAIAGREQLQHMLATFEVVTAAAEEALSLYRQCCRKRLRCSEAKALAGAVLMYVLRRERRNLTFREVADACGSTVKDIGRQFKLISAEVARKGGIVPVQPSLTDAINQSFELYATKFYRSHEQTTAGSDDCSAAADYRIAEVITKAIALSEWIDECTMIRRCPVQMFALSVFFLAFKSVHVERMYGLTLLNFNRTHNLCQESSLKFPSFSKVSPNFIIRTICQVVNAKGGPSIMLTGRSCLFLLDMILQLKPLFCHKITAEMTSVEGDAAFEDFKEVKEAQEQLEMSPLESDSMDDCISSAIPECELDKYILSQKELFGKQEAILRAQLLEQRALEDHQSRNDSGKHR